jgi:hypothetical protein
MAMPCISDVIASGTKKYCRMHWPGDLCIPGQGELGSLVSRAGYTGDGQRVLSDPCILQCSMVVAVQSQHMNNSLCQRHRHRFEVEAFYEHALQKNHHRLLR